MTRVRSLCVLVAAGLLLSCGDGLEPPTTGSIALIIIQDDPALSRAAAPEAAATDTDTTAAESAALEPEVELGVAAYTGARARAEGPTSRSVDLALVDGFWEGELTSLAPGTYTVTVEGLQDGLIAAVGKTSGVDVVAGQQSSASVSLQSFTPTLTVGITSPTTSVEIPVTVAAVQNADGYRVEWATNAEFTGAQSKNLGTELSGAISVSALGSYFVRARALSGSTAGAGGAAKTFEVIGDVPATGGTAATALDRGFGPAINGQLADLNIVPANDADWFAMKGCTGDTLIVETFAARLAAPASKLNTYLRVFGSDGTTLLGENDNLDGNTTDSRVQTLLLGDGRYTVEVTGTQSTTGRYEIAFELRTGKKNTDTYCQVVKTVNVTPATATIAPGATQQFAAEMLDSLGTAIPDVSVVWISSDPNVAVVDTTGLATAIGGGTATITALGQGQPGNAVLTVTGPAFGAPTQLVFSVQPGNTTAGAAFSPAIDVEIRDANNNLVTDARNTVTLAIAANPGSATLYGSKTVNANGGIARFTGLFMTKAAAGYTLGASSSALTGATSTAFTVSPGPPKRLTFGVQPSDVEGNAVMGPAVTVAVSDEYGNPVTNATNTVTLDFAKNIWASSFGTGAELLGTKSVAAVSGVATFNDLRLDKPGAGYELRANSSGLGSDTSAAFAVKLTLQQSIAVAQYYGAHTCAVAASGTYCWGAGGAGQLGTGGSQSDSVPALVTGGLVFTKVAAGEEFSCALTSAGKAYCWGANYAGQLGDGTNNYSSSPVAVSGNLTFSSIAAGEYHACGVSGTDIYCWGNDGNGQLGDDVNYADKNTPVKVAGTNQWTSVATGAWSTCGITQGQAAYCWGDDYYGQLGDDVNFVSKPTPALVTGGYTWSAISVGAAHACGVANAVGRCWGYDGNGGLGNDVNFVHQPTPVTVAGGLSWAQISSGGEHTCGLTTGNVAYCWGADYEGALGNDEALENQPTPVAVGGSITFSSIKAGAYTSCGLAAGGKGYCWGANWQGGLGDGSRVNRPLPVQIVQ